MRYLSVCSGIEAASVAWKPLGWTAAAFSEIDPFARAVLGERFPETPLVGDMKGIADGCVRIAGPIDLLVGGTPCQGFSTAGLGAGLDDPRSGLARQFIRIARRIAPRWLVWENVPGALSTNAGRDFGAVCHALVQLGYSLAYRVLDAQFFGVPQRRRRVFVVGCLGADWRRAAAVLFERQSLSGYPAPRRQEARKELPQGTANRSGDGGQFGQSIGWQYNMSDLQASEELSPPILAQEQDPPGVLVGGRVRRLTPRECERLQGFPDDWTRISWRGRPAEECPMGPRYKALGNSMAVPVMRWIGKRIASVEAAEES